NAWLSLFDKHAFLPVQRFVGLGHYVYFAHDEEFWNSFGHGLVYAGATLVLQLAVGIPAALLLNEGFRGRNPLRGVVLFPYVIPTIVAVILWKWLLNDSYGLVNHLLTASGVTRAPVAWLGKDWIMASLVITSVWQFFPFVVVTYLARLQTIPPELYEAATVDGAGAGSATSPCPRRAACSSSSCCCARSGCSPSSTRCGSWPATAASVATSVRCRSMPMRAASPTCRPAWAPRSRSSCSCCSSSPRPCTSASSSGRKRCRDSSGPRAAALCRRAHAPRRRRLPIVLDAVDLAQALGRDLRDAAAARAGSPDAGELRPAVRRHRVCHVLPQQRARVARDRGADAHRIGA